MTDPTPSQREPNDDPTTDLTGVTVAEAAAILGISTEAVRMRLKRRTLPGAKGEDGSWCVYLSASQRTANADPTLSQRPTERDRTANPTAEFRTDSIRNPLIEQLRSENAYLTGEPTARSRELAAERERADVLIREALGRIKALTANEPELRAESARNPSEAEQDSEAASTP